jgi:hypothetical protein
MYKSHFTYGDECISSHTVRISWPIPITSGIQGVHLMLSNSGEFHVDIYRTCHTLLRDLNKFLPLISILLHTLVKFGIRDMNVMPLSVTNYIQIRRAKAVS